MAWNSLGWLLTDQPGREREAEAAYRTAIDAGNVFAPSNLLHLMGRQPGREGEAEAVYRDALAAGVDIWWPSPNERAARPTIADAIGGPLGMAETALPGVAFAFTYTISGQSTNTSAAVAVGLALALAIARIVRRDTPRHALAGLFGVGLAAFIAVKSGKAETFFLPGLLRNAAVGSAMLISILVRWPLIGVIVTKFHGEDNSWREDPVRVRAFRRATLLWAALSSARLVVQLPLYLAGEVVALYIARTAMGLPLFVLCLWLTWLLVRGVRAPAAPEPEPAES